MADFSPLVTGKLFGTRIMHKNRARVKNACGVTHSLLFSDDDDARAHGAMAPSWFRIGVRETVITNHNHTLTLAGTYAVNYNHSFKVATTSRIAG